MAFLHRLFSSVLVIAAPVHGNVIVFNDGYCDMALFRRGQGEALFRRRQGEERAEGKFLRIVPGRSVQKLMGYRGFRLDVRLRKPGALDEAGLGPLDEAAVATEMAENPVLISWTVPDAMPGNEQRSYMIPDFEHQNYAHFFDFHILAEGKGWDCSEPERRDATDLPATLVVLAAFVATLVGSAALAAAGGPRAVPSWPETMAWAGIAAFYYFYGARQVYDLSLRYMRYGAEIQINTNKYKGDKVWGLHDDTPWISQFFGGRRWDRKDLQIRDLVDSFPLAALFAAVYLGLKLMCQRAGLSKYTLTLLLGAGFVGFLHEFKLLLPLIYAILNYCLARLLVRLDLHAKTLPLMLWVLGLAGLALAGGELTLAQVMRALFAPTGHALALRAEAAGRWLDGFKGELGWTSIFRFWVLRCISWGIDYQRSMLRRTVIPSDTSKSESTEARAAELDFDTSGDDEGARVERHREEWEYRSFSLYMAYLLYPPLYMTGPIITFNAFASYMAVPQRNITGKGLLTFWMRWLLNATLFVAFGHFLYTSAIMTNGPLHAFPESHTNVFDILFHFGQDGETMIWFSFWSLKWLWFKFLVIWRFARGWALADGVAAPENMERCMCNNFSVRGFWRGWHRSFNRWLVRYIFVPLGGSKGVSVLRQFASSAVVFTFVAVWHEPTLLHGDAKERRLLAWGWLFALFVLPELLVERLCRMPGPRAFLDRWPLLTRHLTALGGACCIQLLIIANLVGYSYGLNGASYLLAMLQKSWGMQLFLLAHIAWTAAQTQLMLLIRQRETRAAGLAKLASKSY